VKINATFLQLWAFKNHNATFLQPWKALNKLKWKIT